MFQQIESVMQALARTASHFSEFVRSEETERGTKRSLELEKDDSSRLGVFSELGSKACKLQQCSMRDARTETHKSGLLDVGPYGNFRRENAK